jgi:hypothetical protein
MKQRIEWLANLNGISMNEWLNRAIERPSMDQMVEVAKSHLRKVS